MSEDCHAADGYGFGDFAVPIAKRIWPTPDEVTASPERPFSDDIPWPTSQEADQLRLFRAEGVACISDANIRILMYEVRRLAVENERLRLRVLTAAGDDLCRLTQEEIKELSSGAVQIPPESEFLASCKRFHAQIADTSGVLEGCLTLAQMVAENERLRALLAECWGMLGSIRNLTFDGCYEVNQLLRRHRQLAETQRP